MMILLNGRSLAPKNRFQPEGLALELSERQSTATLTLGPAAPEIGVGDWVTAESGPGAGIVWRVRTVNTQVERETRTVQLEHVIGTLRDDVMFGEITTKMISGGSGSTVSARTAVQYVLNRQGTWRLGDFAYSVSNPYSFNGDSLFDALETISSSLQDCIWEYDFSSFPFTLHIRRLADELGSEMRMDRNIRTLRKTIDRGRMYTRIYPIGKNNLHIDGEYLSKNEDLYGTVSHVETDQSMDTKDKLRAWAQERLDRHCEPFVTVTVSGMDLSRSTGEALDSFRIGRKCRIPLPEYASSITERVTKLSYPDALRDPENVTITLANELMDVATILKQQSAGGGRGARNGAKQAEEDHAWFVDTTEKVQMVAEAVAGTDGEGNPNWSRVSELTVDGNGIDARVVKAEGDIVTNTAEIKVAEDAIRLETQARQSDTRSLSGRIDVQAGKIGLVVEEKDGKNVIKAASIVASINDEGSSVMIEADHIQLSGDVALSGAMDISGGSLRVRRSAIIQGNLYMMTSGSYLQVPLATVNSLRLVGGQSGEYYDLTAGLWQNVIKSAEVVDNVLTLTPVHGDPINFSKAVSLTGGWAAGVYRVQASQNGVVVQTLNYDPPMRLNGTVQATNFSAEITETQGSSTIARKSIYGYLVHKSSGTQSYVDVNTKADGTGTSVARIGVGSDYSQGYNDGWDTAAGLTVSPSAGTATSFVFKAPRYYEKTPGTWVREQVTYTFDISKGTPGTSGYAAVSMGGVTVGQIDISNWYVSGWNAAAGAVVSPASSTSSNKATVRVPASGAGNTSDIDLYLAATANNYADIQYNGITVARVTHDKWNAGYDTAYGYVGMPGAAPSGEALVFTVNVPNAARTGSDAKSFVMTKGTPSSSGGYASVSLGGTVVGRINIGDWWDAGYEVTASQITTSNFEINKTDRGQRTLIGSFSKSSLQANSYILLNVKCHGYTKGFYITVNG